MSEDNGLFRGAVFGGFERNDVMTYIEAMAERHEKEKFVLEEKYNKITEDNKVNLENAEKYKKENEKLLKQIADNSSKNVSCEELDKALADIEEAKKASELVAKQLEDEKMKNSNIHRELSELRSEYSLYKEKNESSIAEIDALRKKVEDARNLKEALADIEIDAHKRASEIEGKAKATATELENKAKAVLADAEKVATARAEEILTKAKTNAKTLEETTRENARKLEEVARTKANTISQHANEYLATIKNQIQDTFLEYAEEIENIEKQVEAIKLGGKEILASFEQAVKNVNSLEAKVLQKKVFPEQEKEYSKHGDSAKNEHKPNGTHQNAPHTTPHNTPHAMQQNNNFKK